MGARVVGTWEDGPGGAPAGHEGGAGTPGAAELFLPLTQCNPCLVSLHVSLSLLLSVSASLSTSFSLSLHFEHTSLLYVSLSTWNTQTPNVANSVFHRPGDSPLHTGGDQKYLLEP